MRLFIATLSTETNTFSPMPTGMSAFEEYFLHHGTATQEPPNLMTEALHLWRARAEALGWDVTESLAAIAEPAGPTVAGCYDALSGEIMADLAAAGGADIVLLQLHGAMVAEHVEDCEGDLAGRIRAVCPDAVIGMALDLHCHLTERMIQACDLIVSFKEYPHDDATPRAAELFDMARRTALGEVAPVMRSFDCRMNNLYLTKEGAMRSFVDGLIRLEQTPGILSVSLSHGFPWADVADLGARVLVIADGDAELAATTAERVGRDFFARRNAVTDRFESLERALDRAAAATEGPMVLADMGDNSGGGAPGDSTVMLRALLDRGQTGVATGIYWDPVATRLCQDAGEGAELRLRIGGKIGPESGNPVDLTARVMRIIPRAGQHLGPGLEPMGTVIWLRTGTDFDILINDLRTQVYHPEAFEQMGIDLSGKSIVTVKSLFHFYAPFRKIAAQVIQVATPGGTCPDFRAIPLTKRKGALWPDVENPFA